MVKISVIEIEDSGKGLILDSYSLIRITLGLNGLDEPQGFHYRDCFGLDGVE